MSYYREKGANFKSLVMINEISLIGANRKVTLIKRCKASETGIFTSFEEARKSTFNY